MKALDDTRRLIERLRYQSGFEPQNDPFTLNILEAISQLEKKLELEKECAQYIIEIDKAARYIKRLKENK